MHRRVARVLRDVDGLVVPAVTPSCARRISSSPSSSKREATAPKDAARVLVGAHAAAARAGTALLDARPGHVLALADGRIGLLGAGVARAIEREPFAGELTVDSAIRDLLSRRDPQPDDLWVARGAAQLAATIQAASSAGAPR